MCCVVIGNESFDSGNIRIVKHAKLDDGYAIQFYIDTDCDNGKLFEIPFNDLLKRDDSINKLDYNYILNCLIHKESGSINLELMM